MKTNKTSKKVLVNYFTLGLLAVLLLPTFGSAQVATISISNTNTTVLNNTPLLFGITFDARTSMIGNSSVGQIGYYDSSGVVIPQVDSIFYDFPMSTLRYPGNAIAVGFNWKKAIGPINTRPNQDLLGNLGSPQPVKFGFDEFMDLTASRGVPPSEIQIMVPIYDSAATGMTATQALAAVPNVISHNADWVEYCNAPNDSSNVGGGIDWAAVRAANGHPNPYGIKIWNIGNEPWSNFEYGPSYDSCNSYLTSVTPIIDAMLAIDSTLKITMPTTGNPTYNLGWSYALLNSGLVSSGKVYALSQHYFPSENMSTQGVNAVENSLNTLITVAATKGVKVIVGDYAHYISPNNPTTAQKDSAMQWLAANLEADFLLMLSQKSTIERANFWVYGNAQAVWHPIRYNSSGNYTLMPAAEIYKILFPAFLNNSVQISTTSPAASDGISYSVRSNAFISNDLNYLNVVAVNRDKINTVPLQVSGTTGYTLNNARLLSATSNTSETILETTATIDTNGNFVLTPMSVLILEYTNAALTIDESYKNNSSIKFYPNPADDILRFTETLTNIEVYNTFGQKVTNTVEFGNSISVNQLRNGIYFIKSNKGIVRFSVMH